MREQTKRTLSERLHKWLRNSGVSHRLFRVYKTTSPWVSILLEIRATPSKPEALPHSTALDLVGMVGLEDLDSKSKDIVWALSQMGGKANTSEIRRYTDIDNTTIINYRLKGKLGADHFGLVETEQPPKRNGPLPAKIATLTDAGHEFADELYTQSVTDAESLVKEIERIQKRVNDLEAELETGETDTEPGDLDERIDTVWNATIAIRDYLIEEHDADLEQYHPRNR